MSRQQSGLACEECRRRKARCDRVRPRCGICAEAGRTCIVVSKRPPRGPKKGQLKDLRTRIANKKATLEQRLVGQEPETSPKQDALEDLSFYEHQESSSTDLDTLTVLDLVAAGDILPDSSAWQFGAGSTFTPQLQTLPLPITPVSDTSPLEISEFALADLDLIYFERIHPIAPMIHKDRYFAWAADEDVSPARCCLRSAIRTIAAAMSAQFCGLADAFYDRTRRMLEGQQETTTATAMASPDDHTENLPWSTRTRRPHDHMELERIQAWLLLAHCEFLRKPELQAQLTAERTVRLLHLSRLFDLDFHNDAADPASLPLSPSSPPASDDAWIETEEKRRTVWVAFVLDRLAGLLSGRPFLLHEELICIRLPMPEEDFQTGRHPTRMDFLPETMSCKENSTALPGFAECVVLASLLGRCMEHHRLSQSSPSPSDGPLQTLPDFWRRHESLGAVAFSAMGIRGIPSKMGAGSAGGGGDCHATLALTTAMAASSTPETPLAPVQCNPMAYCNHILMCCAHVLLSETAESKTWATMEDQMKTIACMQQAYQLTMEVVYLLQHAPRIAFFKMHPLLPKTLAIIARSLDTIMPYITEPDQREKQSLRSLLVALGYLGNANNLARDLLLQLQADLGSIMPTALQIDQSGGIDCRVDHKMGED